MQFEWWPSERSQYHGHTSVEQGNLYGIRIRDVVKSIMWCEAYIHTQAVSTFLCFNALQVVFADYTRVVISRRQLEPQYLP